jgi:CubicO group peptidase (beta-lactamase class C family)
MSLDDDIRKYLPGDSSLSEAVTIRQLIHHTSGIREGGALTALAGTGPLNGVKDDHLFALMARQAYSSPG